MTTAIVIFSALGLATLFGILIVDMRASAAHQRWIEENDKRRFGKE